MTRVVRDLHPNFIEYQKMIFGHPNYKGLPIVRKADGSFAWHIVKPSEIRNQRKSWAEHKAIELGCKIEPGVYAKVMREIHPTKTHVCKICGSSMSIYYLYPNANFTKAITKQFGIKITENDHLNDVWTILLKNGIAEKKVVEFFQTKFDLEQSINTRKEIVNACEVQCREKDKKLLGPGAMSDFPDRFDGFHSYNRCCRHLHDTGRSKVNLKSYTKDRRAYELWSDGNIHAANMFMGSQFFAGTSADHIGAVSLGFIHDPRYLRPMAKSDNSTKRDRLTVEDIESILQIESKTKVYPMTWYSREVWEFIRNNYSDNKDKVSGEYRNMLKQNFINFMFVLNEIVRSGAKEFLIEKLLKPHYEDFMFDYEFNNSGEIISKKERRFTGRSEHEMDRYARIAVDSVFDYSEKENRHFKPDLNSDEINRLKTIISTAQAKNYGVALSLLKELMRIIQRRLIRTC